MMFNRYSGDKSSQPESTLSHFLLAIFKGGDGFGQILYFWALIGSLISCLILIAIGFSYWSWWALLLGLIAGRCYFYLGKIGKELLDAMLASDD